MAWLTTLLACSKRSMTHGRSPKWLQNGRIEMTTELRQLRGLPAAIQSAFVQQLSDAGGANAAPEPLLTLSQWTLSQQRACARRCESPPRDNYCKNPRSQHRRRPRSRAMVLRCKPQSGPDPRVQTRPQNSRCNCRVASLCQLTLTLRLNEFPDKLLWLVLRSASRATQGKGWLHTPPCCRSSA